MSYFCYCPLSHVLIAFLESGTLRVRSTLTCCRHTRESMPAYLYHYAMNAHPNYSAVNQVSMVILGPSSEQRDLDAKASAHQYLRDKTVLSSYFQSKSMQCSRLRQYATSVWGTKRALRHSNHRSHIIRQGVLGWGTYMDRHHIIVLVGMGHPGLPSLRTVRWIRLLWAHLHNGFIVGGPVLIIRCRDIVIPKLSTRWLNKRRS